jgi:MFS transporter, DHA3 family, macrolide efflux protein
MTKADGVPLMEESSKHYSASKNKKSNLTGFILIWVGQFFSMTGSFMTSFALAIWAWEKTGSAQALAMVGVFTYAPLIIVTPFVGVLVDRWNRKLVMMLSDLGAVLASAVVFVLYLSGGLEIWHIYATTAFASAFQAFQWPAYSASVSLMVSKKHYSRASGLISMVESTSNIVGPMLAGALIGLIGVKGILIIDILTFCIAIITLLLVFIPQPDRHLPKLDVWGFWEDLTYGFRFIFSKPGLLGLQLVFFGANFMTVIAWAVVSPMVLARTGGDAQLLGLVESFAAFGGLVGAIFLTLWGGPKKLVRGVLLGWALSGLLGRLLMGISQHHFIWVLSAFLLAFFMPTVNGCNQAIWQRKVPPEKQGRVFSVRRFIAQITIPISMWLSGGLADNVFEPAFNVQGGWGTRLFAPVFGSGEGAGLSMMIAISGVMVALVSLFGFANSEILCVESKLPDYDDADERQSTREDRIMEAN